MGRKLHPESNSFVNKGSYSLSKELLAIIELGGYPNFIPLYQSLGYQVHVVNTQRKARTWLKKNRPQVIVAEYNYQTDFRDQTSNLETLMAVMQKYPDIKLLVFYLPEHLEPFTRFKENHPVWAAIEFPVSEESVRSTLSAVA